MTIEEFVEVCRRSKLVESVFVVSDRKGVMLMRRRIEMFVGEQYDDRDVVRSCFDLLGAAEDNAVHFIPEASFSAFAERLRAADVAWYALRPK